MCFDDQQIPQKLTPVALPPGVSAFLEHPASGFEGLNHLRLGLSGRTCGSEGLGSESLRVRTTLLTVRRVVVGIAWLILLSGCAAEVGQTDLTLHQRAVFPDGTRYELGEFGLSEVDNHRAKGPPKIPGNEVTVSVLVENAGTAIGASDVAMSLAYHSDRGQELVPPLVASGAAVIATGAKGTISKTFRVEDPTELFQTRYLRVRVELPGYPAVTFGGSNP
jgi:hypothetical protein